jgi:hypothetical protein
LEPLMAAAAVSSLNPAACFRTPWQRKQ